MFFILCGPTGSGKTDLSYKMAERFPFEIVNCDVGQFYKPLTIGTAKPDWKKHPVPHHLFDIIDEPHNMAVLAYRTRLYAVIQEIWQRKKIPLLVGGSLFYVRSLFFPPILGQSETSESKSLQKFSSHELWNNLFEIDPERALSLEKNDRYRIERALMIWYTTGKKPSEQKPIFQPIGRFCLTYVTRDRADLYARINQRVMQMIECGWMQEVAELSDTWKEFLLKKKLLGYDDILHCLRNESISTCRNNTFLRETIAQKTRNYAKRQETFWRSFKKDLIHALQENQGVATHDYGFIEELNLTRSSVDVYLDHVAQIFD